jgi:hypothetical protein
MAEGTQGGYASTQGGTLESTVKTIFERHGFLIVPHSEYKRKGADFFSKELLITNMPYDTVYGHRGKTEFLVLSEKYNLRIRIECKWQQSNGSVDEKLPYLYLNAIETMPEDHIMIVIDGEGWKKGAIQWLKDAVSQKKYTTQHNNHKTIQVLSLSEFIAWANKLFR